MPGLHLLILLVNCWDILLIGKGYNLMCVLWGGGGGGGGKGVTITFSISHPLTTNTDQSNVVLIFKKFFISFLLS